MSVKIADKMVQMNGQNYPLMDASAVEYEDTNGNKTNVKDYLDSIDTSSSGGMELGYDNSNGKLSLVDNSGNLLSEVTIKQQYLLSQPISVEVKGQNGYVELKWTDPDDVVINSTTVATWKKTVVVRKEGSSPSSISDGTIVVESTTRNEYSTTPYKDDGLDNETVYFYGIFPCTTDDVYTLSYVTHISPIFKITTFADATDEDIVAMLKAHYNGDINIADYWSVGDKRTIHLDTMEAIGVSESHIAQDQQFVIIGIEHDDLETPINGKTKAAITIQPLKVLSNDAAHEYGYMNSSNTNSGGWEECARRTWCNNVFVNALPSSIQSLVKTVSKLNYKVYNSTNLTTTSDKVFLLSETEVFGSNTNSAGNTEGTQYEYFKTSSNRVKYRGNATIEGSTGTWWVRSPYSNSATIFCCVDISGSGGCNAARTTSGLCPALCLYTNFKS